MPGTKWPLSSVTVTVTCTTSTLTLSAKPSPLVRTVRATRPPSGRLNTARI